MSSKQQAPGRGFTRSAGADCANQLQLGQGGLVQVREGGTVGEEGGAGEGEWCRSGKSGAALGGGGMLRVGEGDGAGVGGCTHLAWNL